MFLFYATQRVGRINKIDSQFTFPIGRIIDLRELGDFLSTITYTAWYTQIKGN